MTQTMHRPSMAAGGGRSGGGGGGGGGICPWATGCNKNKLSNKKTNFEVERADKLMMSCRLRNCRNRKKKKSGKRSGKKVLLKMLSIRENTLASGASPQTPLGELTALPQSP